jgi:hypothetical protein
MAAVLPLWVVACVYLLSEIAQNQWYTATYQRDLKRLSAFAFEPVKTLPSHDKKPILVPMPFNSVIEQSLFFYSPAEVPCFIVPYGWLTHSPHFAQILDRHKLCPFSTSLVQRRDVFFVMDEMWLVPLRTFYREHYALDVAFEPVVNTDATPRWRACHLHIFQARIGEEKRSISSNP